MEQSIQTQQQQQTALAVVLDEAKQNFAIALKDAQSLDIVNNMASAFDAAIIVNRLEAVLTDEVMNAVFMPLMNKRTGFLTDRDPNKPDKRTGIAPKPYPIAVVRTAIIDAAMIGLQPVGGQFCIITGAMYPAKPGFSAILQRMKRTIGLVYSFEYDPEVNVKSTDPAYMAIPCRIPYKTNREDLKGTFKYVAMVKINGETSTTDQLRGKAERKCKKAFVEFLTGIDFGDADASETVDTTYTEVSTSMNPQQPANTASAQQSASERAREIINRAKRNTSAAETQNQPTPPSQPAQPTQPADAHRDPLSQPNLNFDGQTAAQEGVAQ